MIIQFGRRQPAPPGDELQEPGGELAGETIVRAEDLARDLVRRIPVRPVAAVVAAVSLTLLTVHGCGSVASTPGAMVTPVLSTVTVTAEATPTPTAAPTQAPPAPADEAPAPTASPTEAPNMSPGARAGKRSGKSLLARILGWAGGALSWLGRLFGGGQP